MTATAGHPSRFLFDSNFVPGLLTNLVLEEHNNNASIIIDIEMVKQDFVTAGCQSLALLVEYAVSAPNVSQFGSGCIDLDGVMAGPFSLENALRIQELYIGIVRYGITPLQWLAYLAHRIEDVPKDHRGTLESLCAELIEAMRAPEIPLGPDDVC